MLARAYRSTDQRAPLVATQSTIGDRPVTATTAEARTAAPSRARHDQRDDALAARLQRAVAERRRAASSIRPAAEVPRHPILQRLIVNVGEDTLDVELAKENGWIIASDIDAALQRGGSDQAIVELFDILAPDEVEADEDVFLVGHGSPDEVGAHLPLLVAVALADLLPPGHTGAIYSLSCSTGVVNAAGTSAVSELGSALSGRGSSVTGVAGIALGHSAYERGSRAVTEQQYDRFVEHAINKTIHSVNDDWSEWVAKNGVADLRKAALIATVFSMSFYEALERLIRHHLVPVEDTFTSTAPQPSALPAGMVPAGKRRREKRSKRRNRVNA